MVESDNGQRPVLITDPIRDDDIREFSEDRFGRSVHEIQCSAIIGLLEGVFVCESGSVRTGFTE